MLLIIFLGLISKLALVWGDCDFGTPNLNEFDWTKFSGPRPWYLFLHNNNDVENKLDCLVGVFSSPEGNTSLITNDAYDIKKQRHITLYGNATKWNSTGYFEVNHSVPLWNGRAYIVAVDYNRYFIGKLCSVDLNKMLVFVAFRSHHPDEATLKDMLKDLQNNNVDVNQLEISTANHCQQVESPEERESSS